MLDIQRLRMLREFGVQGTLGAVAATMSSTSASVARELALLEADIGVPLLELAERRVRLSVQAEILVAHTEAILARLAQAEVDVAASPAALIGTVRVAGFNIAAPSLMSAVLNLLRGRHPELLVRLTDHAPDAAPAALSAGEIDIALVEEYPGEPPAWPADVEVTELGHDSVWLALPPGTTVNRDRPWSTIVALAEQPWVMEPIDTPSRRWADALLARAGIEADVRFESRDPTVRVRLVEDGHAVALLPDLAWGDGTPTGPTVSIGEAGRRSLSMTVRRDRSSRPVVLAFRRAVRHTLEQALRARPAGVTRTPHRT
ncbi:LysR substrate-binding domain-containing protein [Embleya hyalina]|uniref:Transcriptional regulator n=1 Tax=Embleya hyalina TaxID=516124 RepID=A0A401YQQ4_9ACTN|nr:LysR substrate-binding domain-containing protein [Embleya hyalina]GCD96954.1 transcriptional regulator [Embleya hyalina]